MVCGQEEREEKERATGTIPRTSARRTNEETQSCAPRTKRQPDKCCAVAPARTTGAQIFLQI